MNLGLSKQLTAAFGGVIPIDRPEVTNQIIIDSAPPGAWIIPPPGGGADSNWLVGFISGEGCFRVSIQKSPRSKSNFQVLLFFELTQHCRDEELMMNLKSYLNCGNVKKKTILFN